MIPKPENCQDISANLTKREHLGSTSNGKWIRPKM